MSVIVGPTEEEQAGSELALDTMMKAVGQGARPAYIHHHTAEAARRYAMIHNGILEDATPHLAENVLRALSDKNVPLQAIQNTLLNQVAWHFTRPESEKGIGLRAVQKERVKEMTPAASKRAREIEEVLFHGGIKTEHPVKGKLGVWDGHYKRQALGMAQAIRVLMRDTITLDRVFIDIEPGETVAGKKAYPVMFWSPTDAALMRMVDSDFYQPNVRRDLQRQVEYVQIDPGGIWSVTREYRWDEGEMAFRNPRSDWAAFGYGKSEVEQCLDALIGVIFAMRHNKNYFTDSHLPMGILNLIGNYDRAQLEAFQLILTQEIGTAVGGDYRFPILRTPPGQGVQGAQWVPVMDRARMDMVFRGYMEFCVALVSAVFQIAPEEFGMASFGGPTQALQEADPSSKIQQSQHKGLLPKLYFFTEFFTRAIVEKIDPDFECIIQGLDALYNPENLLEAQLDSQRIANGLTMNQIRRLRDEPELIDPLDSKLWRDIEQGLADQPFDTEAQRQKKIEALYIEAGGEFGDVYDAPYGNAGALQIWSQQHGMNEQAGAQDQMGQMAYDEASGQQASDQAEQQMALGGMQEAQGQAFEEEGAERMADQEARQNMEMRIPMADDAAFPRKARKSMALQGTAPRTQFRRRRYILGPRDE